MKYDLTTDEQNCYDWLVGQICDRCENACDRINLIKGLDTLVDMLLHRINEK